MDDDSTAIKLTRDCLDPWRYLGVSATGGIHPCCNPATLATLDRSQDVEGSRNNEGFRALRDSLLSGDLQPSCQNCHIRKMVPVDVLQRKLAKHRAADAGRTAGSADALAPLRVAELSIDINEKCNLRCDYCAVTSPDYHGEEMSTDVFAKVREIVRVIGPRAVVNVNGHGETTYHPNWMAMCRTVIEAGHRPQIITNLAKTYSDEEVALLAKFSSIQVSLDSDDDELTRKIRKAVRATHIFETIQRIRDAAARSNIRPLPAISLSIGIYAPAIWSLESFIDRIVAFGIRKLTFWNLVALPHQMLVKPVRALDPPDRERARKILQRVRRRMENADIDYVFAGDFDGLIDDLPWPMQVRSTARRAYRALGRRASRLAGVA